MQEAGGQPETTALCSPRPSPELRSGEATLILSKKKGSSGLDEVPGLEAEEVHTARQSIRIKHNGLVPRVLDPVYDCGHFPAQKIEDFQQHSCGNGKLISYRRCRIERIRIVLFQCKVGRKS